MLRFGPRDAPVVVAAPALFEEGNRTRAFLVRILRLLAERGVASALPDLPGQGESLLPTERASLRNWVRAYAAAVEAVAAPRLAFSLRGGALVDRDAPVRARYHFAPVAGASLVRDLLRARRAGTGERIDADALAPPGPPVLLAGNPLSRGLLAELAAAEPDPADRVARLRTDPGDASSRLTGRPLWRASEPDVDEALAVAVADDVAAWVRTCAAT